MNPFTLITAITMALFAVDTAANLTERAARGKRQRSVKRETRRATTTAKAAAKRLGKLLKGRVVVGRKGGAYVLVVVKAQKTVPKAFAGFSVVRKPKLPESLPDATAGLVLDAVGGNIAVAGNNRLQEISAEARRIILRYIAPWKLPKLLALSKAHDRLILAGKSPSDPEVVEIETQARIVMGEMEADDDLQLRALSAERDRLLLAQAAGVGGMLYVGNVDDPDFNAELGEAIDTAIQRTVRKHAKRRGLHVATRRSGLKKTGTGRYRGRGMVVTSTVPLPKELVDKLWADRQTPQSSGTGWGHALRDVRPRPSLGTSRLSSNRAVQKVLARKNRSSTATGYYGIHR